MARTPEQEKEVQELLDKCKAWPDLYPCQHQWVGKQQGGSPDIADSYEWVEYCDLCGIEKPSSHDDIHIK